MFSVLPYNSLDNREMLYELNYCDEVPFDSYENLCFDQSSAYSRYDQITDGFRFAQSIPYCDYFHVIDLGNLNNGSTISLSILSLNIRSIPKHLEHF